MKLIEKSLREARYSSRKGNTLGGGRIAASTQKSFES